MALGVDHFGLDYCFVSFVVVFFFSRFHDESQ